MSDRREITPAISPKNQLSLKNIYSYFTRIVFHVSKCIFISISEYKHMAVKDDSSPNIEVTTLVILCVINKIQFKKNNNHTKLLIVKEVGEHKFSIT
jgi:hypothetical protein